MTRKDFEGLSNALARALHIAQRADGAPSVVVMHETCARAVGAYIVSQHPKFDYERFLKDAGVTNL